MLIHIFLSCFLLTMTSSDIIAKKTKYPCPGKLVKDLDVEDLTKVLEYAKEIKDKELAYKCYFYLISMANGPEIIKEHKLGLADYCFELEEYEKAEGCYEEFFMLYPGSKEAEYAQYKSILCAFSLSLSSDRDQTGTSKTILLIEHFLKKAENIKFIDEAKSIHARCRQKLFEHETHVFENYIKQKKYTGAQKRIEYIEKNFQDTLHIAEYIKYMQHMLSITKDPKTRQFIIRFDLKDALPKKETSAHEKKSMIKKITSFFLA